MGDSQQATREIVEGILNDEDRHINGIEAIQDQISQMGIQLFLLHRPVEIQSF